MKAIDIKRAVLKRLYRNFPNHSIYGEQVEQGLQKPCFFVYLVPVESRPYNERYYWKSLMVKIDYYHTDDEGADENAVMMDYLDILFRYGFDVEGTHLNVQEMPQEVVDGVLVTTLNVEFLQDRNMTIPDDYLEDREQYEEGPIIDEIDIIYREDES